MNVSDRSASPSRWSPMHTWPAWGRWLALAGSVVVIATGFGLMVAGGVGLRLLGLALFGLAAPVTVHAGRAVHRERSRPVEHRYAREFMLAMSLYMALMLFVWPLQKTMEPGALKLVIALAPALPIAWVVVATIRYVLGADELERRQHLEALAVSVAIVGVVSLVLGFLSAAKVLVLDSTLVLLMVYPALCFTYGVTHCVMVWRARAG